MNGAKESTLGTEVAMARMGLFNHRDFAIRHGVPCQPSSNLRRQTTVDSRQEQDSIHLPCYASKDATHNRLQTPTVSYPQPFAKNPKHSNFDMRKGR